jgi:multiple antibiotic resistance protein
VFVALTRDWPPAAARRAALDAVGAAAALVVGFALFGQVVLDYLRVSLESLSIAGGLLLLIVALEMLRGDDAPDMRSRTTVLVPLATPLLAGPGAIATVMVLSRQHSDVTGRVAVLGGIVAAIAVVGTTLLLADRLARVVRTSIVHFLTRVLGLLLSAVAVQLVVDGVRSLVRQGT